MRLSVTPSFQRKLESSPAVADATFGCWTPAFAGVTGDEVTGDSGTDGGRS